MEGQPGILYVVATPIGNIEDITARAVRILTEVPVIACEDTRHTGMLLKRLGIDRTDRRMIAYHERNERRLAPVLVSGLLRGEDCALVSNAGTPLISDPGYRVVTLAREAAITVVPVPGPCAAISALSASGLPTDRFTFLGFLPPTTARRTRSFRQLSEDLGSCVFYIPARNILQALDELAAVHPDARVVIAREMTKVFEEFTTGTPGYMRLKLAGRTLKGEATLIVNLAKVAAPSATVEDSGCVEPPAGRRPRKERPAPTRAGRRS
jgi:16S rRNA (cytidine1402-2'-O)-methyltransferase